MAEDLQKFTVAQLKAICKERKITGYSKLGKVALVQKITESGYVPTSSTGTSSSPALSPDPPPAALPSENAQTSSFVRVSTSALASAPPATESSTGATKDDQAALPKKKAKPRAQKPKKVPIVGDKATPAAIISPSILSVFNTGGGNGVTTVEAADGSDSTSANLSAQAPALPVSQPATSTAVSDAGTGRLSTRNKTQLSQHGGLLVSEDPEDRAAASSSSNRALSATVTPDVSSPLLTSQIGKKRTQEVSLAPALKKQKIQHTSSALKSAAPPPSAFKVPTTPPARSPLTSRPVQSPATTSSQVAVTAVPTTISGNVQTIDNHSVPAATMSAKRFKPLVTKPPAKNATSSTTPASSGCPSGTHTINVPAERPQQSPALYYLDFPLVAAPPSLVPITLPPSLSQRKRVHRWEVILSGLSNAERRQCVLVSRMFRYAIYLSASNLLQRNFAGKRLTLDVLQRYSQAMTNMWPYLRLREAEVQQRRQAYEFSFLADFARSHALPTPIDDRLWASPDCYRQIGVVLRFVMTRMWFALSLGTYDGKNDSRSWLSNTVVDAQEIIKGEIWSITFSSPSSRNSGPQTESFHVLEATCEVVGHASLAARTNAISLRADWSAYISQRLASTDRTPDSLLARIKWSNHEEYVRGVSKLWLARVEREGELGVAKRVVAERYVLACVVGNSISGQWMSATDMAQDFAGLPSRVAVVNANAKLKTQSVNLYLPEHHHVESVHFTTSDGRLLHAALAVVQTPHREYFILRDNGMQVGCEEDGVAEVWQQVLRCNRLGL